VRQVQRWPWERIGRGKLLLRCVCSAAREALGRSRGRRGAGHIVSPRLQLASDVWLTRCRYAVVLRCGGSAARPSPGRRRRSFHADRVRRTVQQHLGPSAGHLPASRWSYTKLVSERDRRRQTVRSRSGVAVAALWWISPSRIAMANPHFTEVRNITRGENQDASRKVLKIMCIWPNLELREPWKFRPQFSE